MRTSGIGVGEGVGEEVGDGVTVNSAFALGLSSVSDPLFELFDEQDAITIVKINEM